MWLLTGELGGSVVSISEKEFGLSDNWGKTFVVGQLLMGGRRLLSFVRLNKF